MITPKVRKGARRFSGYQSVFSPFLCAPLCALGVRYYRLWGIGFCIAALVSCGLDDYPYLPPVPSGNISVELNSKAVINLRNIVEDSDSYFTHFTIYYRIYITDLSTSGRINEGEMSRLNPTLYSDYVYFLPYINSDTNISTSVGTLFRNRNYQVLALEGADIERDILSKNALGTSITLDFLYAPGIIPTLSINGTPYRLQRSTGSGLFKPKPDNRYFLNDPELNASANVSTTVNADVVNVTPEVSLRYTYVSMYIVVTGIDPNFSPIYSAPAFIGILRLPEPS